VEDLRTVTELFPSYKKHPLHRYGGSVISLGVNRYTEIINVSPMWSASHFNKLHGQS
jgi:hypothetical protein